MTGSNGLKNDEKSEVEWQKICTNQNENVQIYGYETSAFKTTATYVSYILTIGFVRLFFHWYPHLHLHATHKKCPLNKATKLLIIDDYQGKYKSYFVKHVKTISTTNTSLKFKNISNDDRVDFIERIKNKKMQFYLENGTRCEVTEYKAFWCKKQCYIWDVKKNVFSRLVGVNSSTKYCDLHLDKTKGLSKEDQLLRHVVYGNNEIVVPVQSIGVLLLLEILNPFYIFQIFTLAVWIAEGYFYYACAIICMSFYGITTSIIQTHKNQLNLRGTVASSDTVRVYRNSGLFENISSNELVPGDIIELPNQKKIVTCDAVLLNGQCIINESMLTGESVPIMKTSLPSNHILYDPKECSHHTLYSGTTIIQTRCYGSSPVLARVIRTGFQTNKGALVAAILYPPPTDFKFDQDSYKFIAILACIATCGFIYTIVTKASRGITVGDIVIKALDIITIVIPVALPAAMTVGKLYAQARLKRAQIYCINNRVINVSGSINCVCFDKTGTLTEDGLDMWGIVPCTNGMFDEPEKNVPKLQHHPLFEGMLVCHSLTNIDGKLSGDPLDMKMFESTEWILEEPDTMHLDKYDIVPSTIVKPPKNKISVENIKIPEIGILQQYQFSSLLQRMSVVIHTFESEDFKAYTKGAPEIILGLSRTETIPKNCMDVLKMYTKQGYRVIAMGRSIITTTKTKISKMSRDEIEQNLEFLGLIVLENRLKEPTVSVIKELRDANMHVIMITGDNIQTAVSVAKECGILSTDEILIDVAIIPEYKKTHPEISFNIESSSLELNHQNKTFLRSTLRDVEQGSDEKKYRFALTGQTWQLLKENYPDVVSKICVRGAIFARMTSDQKQQLVLELIQLGYYVVMCGDGANDCGALRAAHAGVSLSEAESSVASPFTSKIADITCVPKVIKQGRAALVTSFGIFKFMVTYSLTEFVSVIILYSIDSNLTDLEYLFIDICLIVNIAFFFGKTEAYKKKLAKNPPMTSLLSFTPLFSLLLHMIIMIIFQIIAYYTVRKFPWFTPFIHTNDTTYSCYENYSVYCVSIFQYITMAIIFSRGKPYRQPIYTNGAFTFSILLLISICIYITVYPANWIVNALELRVPPVYDWRVIILILAFANFLICYFIEVFIIQYGIEKKLSSNCNQPGKFKKQYLKVEYELKNNSNWPKLNNKFPILPMTSNTDNIIKRIYIQDSESTNTENNQCNIEHRVPHQTSTVQNGLDNPAFDNDDSIKYSNIMTRF